MNSEYERVQQEWENLQKRIALPHTCSKRSRVTLVVIDHCKGKNANL